MSTPTYLRPHAIISFDLSKSNIGYCYSWGEHTEGAWHIRRSWSGSYMQPSAASSQYLSKHLHLTIAELRRHITRDLQDFKKAIPEGCEISVTIEHPIFNNTSSPLQFYLHQSLIDFIQTLGLDLVLYSVGMVKSFMLTLSGQKGTMKSTDKAAMLSLYKSIYETGVPKAYPDPSDITSSDQLDAITLNLLGWIGQAMPLVSIQAAVSYDRNKLGYHFLKNPDLYRVAFTNQGGCSRVAGLSTPDSFFYKELSKKLRTNQHLSLTGSKMFFPYQSLLAIDCYLSSQVSIQTDRKLLYSELSKLLKFSQEARRLFLEEGSLGRTYSSFGHGFFVETPYSIKGN